MEKAKYRAYICCGVNCGPKGASALVDFMEAEIAHEGLDADVTVSATGCQAHCDSGPTMVLYPGPIYYEAMDQTRVRRIIKEHLTSDVPVKEYFWTGVRRRILADGSVIVPRRIMMPEDSGGSISQSGPSKQKPRPRPPDVDDFKW